MRRISVLANGAVASDADTEERYAAFAKSWGTWVGSSTANWVMSQFEFSGRSPCGARGGCPPALDRCQPSLTCAGRVWGMARVHITARRRRRAAGWRLRAADRGGDLTRRYRRAAAPHGPAPSPPW